MASEGHHISPTFRLQVRLVRRLATPRETLKAELQYRSTTVGSHSDTSCATRAVSASASVRNALPNQAQSRNRAASPIEAIASERLTNARFFLSARPMCSPWLVFTHSALEPGKRNSSRTSYAYVKSEPEEDWFLLGVQKPEPSDVFDFLESPPRWRWPEWNSR